MAFGKINFNKEGLNEGLSGSDKLLGLITRKHVIKVDVQCISAGVTTCVALHKELMHRITPGEQIDLEMALDSLVSALDAIYSENKDVVDWLTSMSLENLRESEEE